MQTDDSLASPWKNTTLRDGKYQTTTHAMKCRQVLFLSSTCMRHALPPLLAHDCIPIKINSFSGFEEQNSSTQEVKKLLLYIDNCIA